MKPITCSLPIDAPPDVVFAAFADIPNAPSRIKGITRVEMLTPGPVGQGTKFKETRTMFKRESTETLEFTAFEPPHRYEIGAYSCGVDICFEFRFVPEGTGTRVEVTMAGVAKTFFAKLMSPLSGLMAGAMKKCVLADMKDIKTSVEGSAVAT